MQWLSISFHSTVPVGTLYLPKNSGPDLPFWPNNSFCNFFFFFGPFDPFFEGKIELFQLDPFTNLSYGKSRKSKLIM